MSVEVAEKRKVEAEADDLVEAEKRKTADALKETDMWKSAYESKVYDNMCQSFALIFLVALFLMLSITGKINLRNQPVIGAVVENNNNTIDALVHRIKVDFKELQDTGPFGGHIGESRSCADKAATLFIQYVHSMIRTHNAVVQRRIALDPMMRRASTMYDEAYKKSYPNRNDKFVIDKCSQWTVEIIQEKLEFMKVQCAYYNWVLRPSGPYSLHWCYISDPDYNNFKF